MGYKPYAMSDGRGIMFATPEKALFDFLYLNPYYNTESEILDLRLDEDYMAEEFNFDSFEYFCSLSKNDKLQQRIKLLLKLYRQ